jgi:hypothetical protein
VRATQNLLFALSLSPHFFFALFSVTTTAMTNNMMFRRRYVASLALLLSLSLPELISASFVSGRISPLTAFCRGIADQRTRRDGSCCVVARQQKMVLHNMFEQRPGESNADFFKRIHEMSQDAETFERTVLNDQKGVGAAVGNATSAPHCDASSQASVAKKKGTYQRAEDWEAEQNENGKSTWDQKVQFDGQRLGNQVRQDSILREAIRLNTR